MSRRPRGACLLVFARDPRPGRVKTRLVPALGPDLAVAVYRELLRDTLQTAAGSTAARLELWVDRPDPGSYLTEAAHTAGMQLHSQRGSDLGLRMHHALAHALARCGSAVLIGSDCPEFDPDYLDRAFDALRHRDAVIGPAADGGYVLIGLKRPQPALFRGIRWGGPQVLETTRARLRSLGLDWQELRTLHDLDEPGDLARFPRLAARARAAIAPGTRAPDGRRD
jgi:rSAM/selenodomain-associated transferase 1